MAAYNGIRSSRPESWAGASRSVESLLVRTVILVTVFIALVFKTLISGAKL